MEKVINKLRWFKVMMSAKDRDGNDISLEERVLTTSRGVATATAVKRIIMGGQTFVREDGLHTIRVDKVREYVNMSLKELDGAIAIRKLANQ